jgi:hypothetical protein
MVLAPRNATRLEVSDLDGHVLDNVSMGAGVASIHLADGKTVKLRALDAGGNEVGMGVAPMPTHAPSGAAGPEEIDNWS